MGKKKLHMGLAALTLASCFTAPVAFADTTVNWKDAVSASYSTSFPGTILAYKDELNQGGMNLTTQEITTNKDEADIVFDDHPDIAASGVIDLGSVDFDEVNSVPDNGYSTEVSAKPGHVYIVGTHDGSFAKIYIKSIVGSKVFFKYALEDSEVENTSQQTNPPADQKPNPNENSDHSSSDSTTPSTIAGNTTNNDNQTDNSSNTNDSNMNNDNNTNMNNTQPRENHSIVLKIGASSANVDGSAKVMDVAPITVNNRTLVPLRFIGEALGAQIDWNSQEQRVTMNLNGDTIVLWLGKPSAIVNGQIVSLDVPPVTYSNRTMVPVRFVSESLKQFVHYDPATQQVSISSSDSPLPANHEEIPKSSDLSPFFHTFLMAVPGAVVDTPATGTQVTPGALSGGLTVNSDGTYIWNSTWEGKVLKGSWKATGDPGYPILLLNGEDGHDWKLGKSTPSTWGGGDIVIWDGSIWKNGTVVK
jgi:hypothetical protein